MIRRTSFGPDLVGEVLPRRRCGLPIILSGLLLRTRLRLSHRWPRCAETEKKRHEKGCEIATHGDPCLVLGSDDACTRRANSERLA